MKGHFNREIVMTEEENQSFRWSTRCWICDNTFVEGDVKVSDCCHAEIVISASV